MMTISKALKERKELKERLSRMTESQSDNFEVTIPIKYKNVKEAFDSAPGEMNFMSFNAYEVEITKIITRLRILRNAIDQKAHETVVNFNGNDTTLAMIRILVEDERSAIDRLKKLNGNKSRRFSIIDRESRLKSDDMEKTVQQIPDKTLEEMIDSHIKIKTDLEAVLEKTNVETEINI